MNAVNLRKLNQRRHRDIRFSRFDALKMLPAFDAVFLGILQGQAPLISKFP
jgi:hypothetical protein